METTLSRTAVMRNCTCVQHNIYETSNTKSPTQWVTVYEVYYKFTLGSLRPSINKLRMSTEGDMIKWQI